MKKRSTFLVGLLVLAGALSRPATRATTLSAEGAAAAESAPLPDLIIQGGSWGSSKVAGDGNTYVIANFVVSNIGQATAGRCKARMFLAYKGGGAPSPRYVDLDVASLPPSGKTNVQYKYSYPTKGPAVYLVRAIVDPEDQVVETNENNNQ